MSNREIFRAFLDDEGAITLGLDTTHSPDSYLYGISYLLAALRAHFESQYGESSGAFLRELVQARLDQDFLDAEQASEEDAQKFLESLEDPRIFYTIEEAFRRNT